MVHIEATAYNIIIEKILNYQRNKRTKPARDLWAQSAPSTLYITSCVSQNVLKNLYQIF